MDTIIACFPSLFPVFPRFFLSPISPSSLHPLPRSPLGWALTSAPCSPPALPSQMCLPGTGSRTSAALSGSRQTWPVSCGRSSRPGAWTSTATLNGHWSSCWRLKGLWKSSARPWTRLKVCGRPGNPSGTSSLTPCQSTSSQPRYPWLREGSGLGHGGDEMLLPRRTELLSPRQPHYLGSQGQVLLPTVPCFVRGFWPAVS